MIIIKILAVIGVILLALEVVRLLGSSIYIMIKGKALGFEKPLSMKMRIWNIVNILLVLFGFLWLIIHFKY